MKLDDQLRLGIANLWRTKLRTVLTTLGVTIGIGALVSMLSFGTGMQKNITQTFKENDLFTSMQVTPKKIDVEEAISGDVEGVVESLQEETPVLGDSALQAIREIPGIQIAFPEVRFPVKIQLGENNTRTTLRALPAAMGCFKPFNQLGHGQYFSDDTASSIILSPRVLRELKVVLHENDNPQKVSIDDSLSGMRSVHPDSLLGREIEVITSVVDVGAMVKNPFRFLHPSTQTPMKETSTRLTLCGIQKKADGFEGGSWLDAGAIVPIKTADRIPHLGFSSVWSLLSRSNDPEGYASIYVRLGSIADMDTVKARIESMGFGVFSILDQLEEIRKGFLIFDAFLGAVGAIALIVAALGIINTMVMSILERTREIGVMKAIGGSETEIKNIFFFEAGAIGLIGGVFGLCLGWVVTRIANIVANFYIAKQGGPHVDLFYIPLWLILGALAFSILVSLLAGLYPAVRAARIDPVKALRHD